MIGLFLGDTDFPEIVLKKIRKLKKEYFLNILMFLTMFPTLENLVALL